MKQLGIALGLMTALVMSSGVFAEEESKRKSGFESGGGFGGPGSTTEQLAEDDLVKNPTFVFDAFDQALAPWFAWKKKVNQQSGIQLGMAYTSLFQSADEAPPGVDEDAASGIFRISGKWVAFQNEEGDSGTVVFNVDHRHAYDGSAPADLGFATGYLGIPGTLFNNSKTILGDLNYQYRFNDGNSGLILGRYDPNDYLDVLGYSNPWTTFQNLYILNNASIALPDWGTGVGIGHRFSNQVYALGHVSDANGVATETKFFEDFSELYSSAEIGWSPTPAERYLKNFHLTVWHVDDREEAGVPESEGYTLGANWTWNNNFMVFGKAGWSDGLAPLLQKSFTVGMIYYFESRTDLFGAAINWGEPADPTLEEQTTTEIFYRWQLAQNLAVTPSIQYIQDPALNPADDEILYTGIRVRFSL